MARTSYSYEKFMREKKKAEKKKQREEDKRARLLAKKDGEGGAPVVDGADVDADGDDTDRAATDGDTGIEGVEDAAPRAESDTPPGAGGETAPDA